MLRRLRTHPLKPVELLVDGDLDRFGRVEISQLRAVLVGDVLVAFTEFLSNGCHLLAQQVLTLLLVHAFADVVANRLGDLQLVEVIARPRVNCIDAVRDVGGAQYDESVVVGEFGPERHGISECAGFLGCPKEFGQATRVALLGNELKGGAQFMRGRGGRRA